MTIISLENAMAAAGKKLNPEQTKGLNAVYQFNLTGDPGGTFCVTFVDGVGTITPGAHEKADVSITTSAKDFMKLAEGKLNPGMAFFTGKIKLKGDMGLGLKLQSILG